MFHLIPSNSNRWAGPSLDQFFANVDSVFGREPLRVADGGYSPRVDIREDADALVLEAELPGVEKDAVTVEVHNKLLTISGEKKAEEVSEGRGYYRSERAYGAFRRSFRLPDSVEGENVDATFKDGVLTIKLPKKAEAQARQIEIHN